MMGFLYSQWLLGPTATSSVDGLASTLQTTGGWGLSAILMFVIVFLWRYIMRLLDEREKGHIERNEQMLELIEKRIERDIKHEQAFNNLSELIERLLDKL